ncbi:ABC transporter permease [Bacillus luteolus]|uniref:Cell division protein FtsX n=1 Tax=Litchfieldia luteola TaxID=682179 RepID=A0ABR9QEX8_9BACI|nr:permease-like cell division protein FtsX [Cytobacillus luteolus]MBE4907035.1 ABC transporter permease [Cytobacillus luteolus]MBP1943498.1 cell division transport system permease protein [Cytobacillus luteolus]
MKFSTLIRHLRESIKNLGRNGWMTFASVSAVTVTLLLVGVFIVIMMNLNSMATSIEEDVRIRVHIDLTATPEDQEELRKQIEKIPQVSEIVFSSKDEELENLKKSLGDEGSIFALVEQNNPLHDVFVVKTTVPNDISVVAKKIERFSNVASAKYGQGEIEKLFSAVEISRNIGLALIMGLIFTAMFLISNTIKITIVARRKEIEIMKLVGATNSFIRWPFFLEGLFLGALGSIIPISVILGSYNYLLDLIQPKLAGTFFQLLPFQPFAIQVAILLVSIGSIIGVWGSLMSVRKFLRV